MSPTEIFRDESLELETRLDDLMSQLSLHEKFQLCSGKSLFKARGLKRLGIKPFAMSDGPVGVAFHSSLKRNTYFPATIGLAATWNKKLCSDFGEAIAKETRAVGRSMILGPGINICRTPLNGRTFEYLGEDPFQNTSLAVPIIKAIQSQRVAACVKHYAANNQETKRFSVDVQVSKRALEEIYLPAFKASVEQADAWSFMACYNKVNGLHGCEHKDLLIERLVNNWGFKGFVVSDWFATSGTQGAGVCVEGGLALEMPGKFPPVPTMKYHMQAKSLRTAFEKGDFSEASLNRNLRAYLRTQMLTGAFDLEDNVPKGERNTPAIRKVARDIAAESMVLLKNEPVFQTKKLLPLDINAIKTMAIVGPNKNKRMAYVGYGGSSAVWPAYEITPLKGLKEKAKDNFKIIKSVEKADVAVVVVGLHHRPGGDAEGWDRKTLSLSDKQVELIKQTANRNKNTIVVLVSGSPVSMDEWIDDVPVVLEAWYAGMEGGRALADILFGDVNPSGKLPITFPKRLEDSPAHKNENTFPGNEKVFYEEGIFVGYRHFDKENIEPLFPFGFGLSYSEFEYSNLILNTHELCKNKSLVIEIDIKNTSHRKGAEVAQLFISEQDSSVERPPKELKGFEKIEIDAGEQKTLSFTLSCKDLAYFDEQKDAWFAKAGTFDIAIGASSRDIKLSSSFNLNESVKF
jgi:beta-glucosidase